MRNTIENIIIALVVFIFGNAMGGLIGYKAAVNAIETQQVLIQQAIDKNTSEIQNTFTTEIKKLKNKNGEAIITTEPETVNDLNHQSTEPKKKNGIFNRNR